MVEGDLQANRRDTGFYKVIPCIFHNVASWKYKKLKPKKKLIEDATKFPFFPLCSPRLGLLSLLNAQFSHSVMSHSLWPHGLQHTRLPWPSPTLGACSNSCPYSGDAIQPSHPLSSPSPSAFNLSQHQDLFQWVSSSPSGGQSIGVSASVLPMNIQDRFPLGLTGLISLQSKGKPGVLEKRKSWRRERLPTPVFWPGVFHGVCSPWGRNELDMTEWLSLLNCRPVLFKLWLFFPNPLQWVLL